jgi:hypothetical protein
MLHKAERFKQPSLTPNFHSALLSRGPGSTSNKIFRIINAKDTPKGRRKSDEE